MFGFQVIISTPLVCNFHSKTTNKRIVLLFLWWNQNLVDSSCYPFGLHTCLILYSYWDFRLRNSCLRSPSKYELRNSTFCEKDFSLSTEFLWDQSKNTSSRFYAAHIIKNGTLLFLSNKLFYLLKKKNNL